MDFTTFLLYNITIQRRVASLADTSELKIITDETLMEKRTHGQSVFPFQYYLEDIWDFDFHTIGWH